MTSTFSARIIAVLLLLAGLTACAPSLPPADPAHAKQLRNEGLQLALKHDYDGAAARYREAIRFEPGDSSGYLHLAEFLQALQRPSDALDIYESALRRLPAGHGDREKISYYAGLLEAGPLDSPRSAKSYLGDLKSPVYKADLSGLIALTNGDTQQALQEFLSVSRLEMERDEFARVQFHIALAYDKLGNEDGSRQALLAAIPKAESRSLKEEIRRFFEGVLARRK